MAIKLDLQQSGFGVSFNAAYFRISCAQITRHSVGNDKFSVMLDVVGYATHDVEDNTREIDFRRYYAPMSDVESYEGIQFLDKCYAWVMKQPDMVGCAVA